MLFELEGEPERVIRAGEGFWEPGGDVIHYQDGNNRKDTWSRFVVTMMCVPGKPMLSSSSATRSWPSERTGAHYGRPKPVRDPRTALQAPGDSFGSTRALPTSPGGG